jgi:ATP-dependent DNA helicase RecG
MSSKPAHTHETHRIEFKRELTPELDLKKEVIAFLSRPVCADEEAAPFTGQIAQEPESRPESQLESKLAARVRLMLDATALGKLALTQGLGHQSVSGELNKQIRRLQRYRLTDTGKALLK